MKHFLIIMLLTLTFAATGQVFNIGLETGFNANYFTDGDITVGGNGMNYYATLEAASKKDYGFYMVFIGGRMAVNADSMEVSRTTRAWVARGGVGFTNSEEQDLRVGAYLTGGFLTSPDLNIPQLGAGVSVRLQKFRIQPNLRLEMGFQPNYGTFKVNTSIWMNANIGVSYALSSRKPSAYQTSYY